MGLPAWSQDIEAGPISSALPLFSVCSFFHLYVFDLVLAHVLQSGRMPFQELRTRSVHGVIALVSEVLHNLVEAIIDLCRFALHSAQIRSLAAG